MSADVVSDSSGDFSGLWERSMSFSSCSILAKVVILCRWAVASIA